MKAGIAGAGIAGRLLAVELLNAGWSVALFDQEQTMEMNNCSRVAGGLLTPVTELEKCDPIIFSLGQQGLNTYWPALLENIEATEGFQKKGSLAIAHPKDSVELKRLTNLIDDKLPDAKNYQILNRSEILALEPELTKWDTAFYMAEEGCLNAQIVMAKLATYLLKQKAVFHLNHAVTEVLPFSLTTSQKKYHFDWVFDCRGLGAREVFNDLRGVRGELLYLYAPDVNISRPIRLFHPRYPLYIVPKTHPTYILGASEIESEDRSEISVRTTLELLSSAYYLHPGFLEARVIQSLTHCRPTLNDHLPKIKYTKGLIALNGLYRHGFLIAPSLVAEILKFLREGIGSIKYPELWELI